MSAIIPALLISILLVVFYIFLTYWYKSYLDKIENKRQQKLLAKQIEKYIPEEKKDEMKEKLEKISNLIKETEKSVEDDVKKKVKVAEIQAKLKDKESEIIEQAEKEYRIQSAGLRSALPRTEEELFSDMEILKESISILESFDEEFYLSEPKKADVGTGMFYDKMTRRLQRIIKENNLSEFKIIPIQRLKYYAFSNVKNIKDTDFLPILNLMKETKLIGDFVEINPKFHIIVFSNEEYDFSNPENVILTFAYEKKKLTIEELLELTEWDFTYASKVLNELFSKELATIMDDMIAIEGFGSEEERKKWNEIISQYVDHEKEKVEEKEKNKIAITERIQESVVNSEKIRLKEDRLAKKRHDKYIIESNEELEQIDNDIPIIKFKGKPQVKKIADLGKISEFKGKTFEELSDKDLKNLISQKILSYHETYSLLNGGFVQYKKLSTFIIEHIKNATEELIQETITKLIKLEMIHVSFEMNDQKFYAFKEINLNQSDKEFISFALEKEPMKKEDFIEGLQWDEEEVLSTMQNLQSKGILRIEQNAIIIPGILQKK